MRSLLLTAIAALALAPSVKADIDYFSIPTAFVIYTNYYYDADTYQYLSAGDVSTIQGAVYDDQEHLWISSQCNALTNVTFYQVTRTLSINEFAELSTNAYLLPSSSVQQDLYNLGIQDNQYSAIVVIHAWADDEYAYRWCGGANWGSVCGDSAYVVIPLTTDIYGTTRGVLEHEYLHVMDTLFWRSGMDSQDFGTKGFHSVDQPGTFFGTSHSGKEFQFNTAYLIPDSRYDAVTSTWVDHYTAADSDGDGLPDSGSFPVTEATFGTNAYDADSDDDGLSDLEELTATWYASTDPLDSDTDNDGISDSADPCPLNDVVDEIGVGTPTIDGALDAQNYTFITHFNGASADVNADVYAAWNGDTLYVAFDVVDEMISVYYDAWWNDCVMVLIDVNEDGWFFQSDPNYRILASPYGDNGNAAKVGTNFRTHPDYPVNGEELDVSVDNITAKYAITQDGYVIEMAIPDSALSGLDFGAGATPYISFQLQDYDEWGSWPRFNVLSGGDENEAVFVQMEMTGGGGGDPAFQEASGLVAMEAENYHDQIAGTGAFASHSWITYTSYANYSGDSALMASPNTGQNAGDSTIGVRLDYDVDFETTGTYYVWVRMWGSNGNNDSLHAGLDGTPATYGNTGMTDSSNQWHWEQNVNGRPGTDRVTVNVTSAGVHTFNIWMREDGTAVDKIVLTTNSAYTPSGAGPSESDETGSLPDTTPPTPNPLSFATEPYAASSTSASMQATTATDPAGSIQYYFQEVSNNSGGGDSGWISSTSYTDSGLTTGLVYGYRVKARDALGHETGWSETVYVYVGY